MSSLFASHFSGTAFRRIFKVPSSNTAKNSVLGCFVTTLIFRTTGCHPEPCLPAGRFISGSILFFEDSWDSETSSE